MFFIALKFCCLKWKQKKMFPSRNVSDLELLTQKIFPTRKMKLFQIVVLNGNYLYVSFYFFSLYLSLLFLFFLIFYLVYFQLSRHKIIDQDLTSEAGVGLAVRLSNLPLPRDCDASLVPAPQPSVLECVLRLPDESQGTCLLEMIMDNCPLEGLSANEKGPTRHLLFEYKIQEGKAHNVNNNKGGEGDNDWAKLVVGKLLNDWYSVCKLYRHAVELDTFLKGWLIFLI